MRQLLTIMTPNISNLCYEFKTNHAEYAQTRGYNYICTTEVHWPDYAAAFSKLWCIHEALQNPENTVVLWADADIAFTDMTTDLADLLEPDYWLAGYAAKITNRLYICTGLMVIRNGEIARTFFEEMLATEPIWIQDGSVNNAHGYGWEQQYIDKKLVERNFAGVRGCTRDEIGGFSQELWNDGEPWVPGCPTVHISDCENWARRRDVLLSHYLPAVVR